MELQSIIVPVVTGVLAFAGSVAGTRVEIQWIKERLRDHTHELNTLHKRISDIDR